MPMLKIGNTIINTAFIVHVDLNATASRIDTPVLAHGVRITVVSHEPSEAGYTKSESFFFGDKEAEMLRWYYGREIQETDLEKMFKAEQKKINGSEQSDKKIWL